MTRPTYVLGLHPSSRGFGWALFDGPGSLVDFGSAEIHGSDKNAKALLRIQRLLDRYQPRVLALEVFDDLSSKRRPRIRRLYRSLLREAGRHEIAVHALSRSAIAGTFAISSSNLRHATASAVAEQIPGLRSRLPGRQKIWLGEDHQMGLFCAAACALTYYASLTQEQRRAA